MLNLQFMFRSSFLITSRFEKENLVKDIDLFSEELIFYYKLPSDNDININSYWILEIDESKKQLLAFPHNSFVNFFRDNNRMQEYLLSGRER